MLFVFFRPDMPRSMLMRNVDEWAFLSCLRDALVQKKKKQLITGEAESIINNVFHFTW